MQLLHVKDGSFLHFRMSCGRVCRIINSWLWKNQKSHTLSNTLLTTFHSSDLLKWIQVINIVQDFVVLSHSKGLKESFLNLSLTDSKELTPTTFPNWVLIYPTKHVDLLPVRLCFDSTNDQPHFFCIWSDSSAGVCISWPQMPLVWNVYELL